MEYTAEEVNELISEAAIAVASPTCEGQTVLSRMYQMEESLVRWLISVIRSELQDDLYRVSQAEVEWTKRIARFYHKMVPLEQRVYSRLQTFVQRSKRRKRTKLFVSHAGVDKLSYAVPLADYLISKGVRDVFIVRSMRVGSHPDDEMLSAAVSCTYFWCVMSKEFVQKYYPMRELLRGYVRHVREPPSGFVLILDCHEKEPHSGNWRDRIVNGLQSLKLYREGGEEYSFPGSALEARTGESFNERIKRITTYELADGRRLVPGRAAMPYYWKKLMSFLVVALVVHCSLIVSTKSVGQPDSKTLDSKPVSDSGKENGFQLFSCRNPELTRSLDGNAYIDWLDKYRKCERAFDEPRCSVGFPKICGSVDEHTRHADDCVNNADTRRAYLHHCCQNPDECVYDEDYIHWLRRRDKCPDGFHIRFPYTFHPLCCDGSCGKSCFLGDLDCCV